MLNSNIRGQMLVDILLLTESGYISGSKRTTKKPPLSVISIKIASDDSDFFLWYNGEVILQVRSTRTFSRTRP